jgi:hypothetical protein
MNMIIIIITAPIAPRRRRLGFGLLPLGVPPDEFGLPGGLYPFGYVIAFSQRIYLTLENKLSIYKP